MRNYEEKFLFTTLKNKQKQKTFFAMFCGLDPALFRLKYSKIFII